MARLADYFVVVGYDLEKRGKCLSLASDGSLALAVGVALAEKEAGTRRLTAHS